jgi:hypothetical protein
MVAFNAEDLKAFTAGLFMQDVFDAYLLEEAEITTFCTFSINGRMNRTFFADEEPEEAEKEEWASWKKLKPLCFDLIKGKRLPVSFRIVLKLSGDRTAALLEAEKAPFQPSEVGGLYLNIKYEDRKLTCVSMASLNVFSTDKTLERIWDSYTEKLFQSRGIAVSCSD